MPINSAISGLGPNPNSNIAGSNGVACGIVGLSGPTGISATSNYVTAQINSNGITRNQSLDSSVIIDSDCSISGELKVGGVSITDQLAKINERLAILVPDPVLLEKYTALQELYAQYKTLEALCK